MDSNDVYNAVKKIPHGKVSTYKDVAHYIGTKAYRAVGNALNKNHYAPSVPCHRVIKSNGEIGGFASGVRKKVSMLRDEGIEIIDGKIDLMEYLYKF